MTKYEIREQGFAFDTIEADTPEQALQLAAERPIRACDYNGYCGPVTWHAFTTSEEVRCVASLTVQVKPCVGRCRECEAYAAERDE